MSIRLRLAALFTLVALVLLSVGGFAYIRQLRHSLEGSFDQELLDVATTMMEAFSDDPRIRLPAETDGNVQIFDADGTRIRSSRAVYGVNLASTRQVIAATHGHILRFDQQVALLPDSTRLGDIPLILANNGQPPVLRVVAVGSGKDGRVFVAAASRGLIDTALRSSEKQIALFGAIALLLAAVSSWLLARAALRPVERMRAQVARLREADTAELVPAPGTRDKIALLGKTFNGLLGRLHAALQRERSFVADAGHELRTPLSVLKGELELAQRPGRSAAELQDTITVAAEETDRLIRLTENMLTLARGSNLVWGTVDLNALAHGVALAAHAHAAENGVTIEIRDLGADIVDGDPDRLRRAIENLLTNAVRFGPTDSTITISVSQEGADAAVSVRDTGPGFPSEFLPRAFERFARADDARNLADGGSGPGLAIVAAIMKAHGGSAAAANSPEGGAVVILRWPRVQEPSA